MTLFPAQVSLTKSSLATSKFYNTDTSIQEAYGIARDGPPQQQGYDQDMYYEEEGGEFQ